MSELNRLLTQNKLLSAVDIHYLYQTANASNIHKRGIQISKTENVFHFHNYKKQLFLNFYKKLYMDIKKILDFLMNESNKYTGICILSIVHAVST